ncbi:MAG: ABC transporter ATP-binding protein [Treponema sp.]|jgi:iron complex transport system ATP-binding protein|nr:ABC transporter ATP-binding protein [Treponema sp.]
MNGAKTPLLEAEDISFSYETGKPVFSGVFFTLDAGEIYTILGANGAGKSTLLACLQGMLPPGSGTIRLDGQDIRGISPGNFALKVGIVAQAESLRFDFTVADYLVLGRAPHIGMLKVPGKAEYKMAEHVMEQMRITHLARKPMSQLSGGEKQQAQIARVLVQNPKLILMDEPANHLDYGNQIKVLKTIIRLAEEGIAVILSTHIPDHAILLDARAGILDNEGRLTSGSAEEIVTQENLSRIYKTGMYMAYIPEIKRRACVACNIR